MGLVLPGLSGLLLFLSFPLYTKGYLAFISLIPLFYSIHNSAALKKVFVNGIIFGLTYSILISYPLFHALTFNYEKSIIYSLFLVTAAAVIPQSLLYGAVTFLSVYLKTKNSIIQILIIPSIWTLADYLKELIPVFIPWAFAGYTQVYTPFIQAADITGIYGITFIIILVNVIFTTMITGKKYQRGIALLCSILIPLLAYSLIRVQYINHVLDSSPDSAKVKISAIQGNFTSGERWNTDLSQLRFNTFSDMTMQVLPVSDIIVWPETVLNSSDELNIERTAYISSMLNDQQYFISGMTRSDGHQKNYNSALLADKKHIVDIYDKMILFPYSESSYSGLSAGKFLNAPEQFEPGNKQNIFKTEKGSIGVTLCFESIYPYFVRKLRQAGSDYIINISNDSWFGRTSEPYLHFYSNIARAVELRLPVIRAANSGISAIIDQTGRTTSFAPVNTRAAINGNITICGFSSLYSVCGDIILLLCSLLILAAIYTRL